MIGLNDRGLFHNIKVTLISYSLRVEKAQEQVWYLILRVAELQESLKVQTS